MAQHNNRRKKNKEPLNIIKLTDEELCWLNQFLLSDGQVCGPKEEEWCGELQSACDKIEEADGKAHEMVGMSIEERRIFSSEIQELNKKERSILKKLLKERGVKLHIMEDGEWIMHEEKHRKNEGL